jgi:hypothetical protein
VGSEKLDHVGSKFERPPVSEINFPLDGSTSALSIRIRLWLRSTAPKTPSMKRATMGFWPRILPARRGRDQ